MSQLTDWELGNDMMHNVVDNLRDCQKKLAARHPDLARMCEAMAGIIGKPVNDLMEPEDGTCMCPESANVKADLHVIAEVIERNPKWLVR